MTTPLKLRLDTVPTLTSSVSGTALRPLRMLLTANVRAKLRFLCTAYGVSQDQPRPVAEVVAQLVDGAFEGTVAAMERKYAPRPLGEVDLGTPSDVTGHAGQAATPASDSGELGGVEA